LSALTGHGGDFREAARAALGDAQLRRNMGAATDTIRARRADAVAEVPDWEELREAGRRIKSHTLEHLDEYLVAFEAAFQAAGGTVHWARDAAEANRIVVGLVSARGATRVVKVKSLTTDEIGLNDALLTAGVAAVETDLAELIVQLAGETSSHILVPAIHKNRTEIRDLFRVSLDLPDLSDDPPELAEAARLFLRRRFLDAEIGISGANFAVAETGSLCVVESEGNGRMCTTLPAVLISLVGIEKLVPAWSDLEVFLQILSRSATGERMSPYTTIWTGVADDGPREVHVVLLDNGRSATLADEVGRAALRCIRCSACLNVCPVYSRTGGHAYESVYPGPIGAILTPQLRADEGAATSLPWASSLCGACYEVCPVKIDIPEILVHLRAAIVERGPRADPEGLVMRLVGWGMAGRRRYEWGQRLTRLGLRPFTRRGVIRRLPGPLRGWTSSRDLQPPPDRAFRDWWEHRR